MENVGTFVIIVVAHSTRKKLQWDNCRVHQPSQIKVSLPDFVILVSIRGEVSILQGKIAGVSTEIMLTSVSSVSLPHQEIVFSLKGITRR